MTTEVESRRTRRGLLREARGLGLFLAMPLLGAVIPVVLYPAVTARFGAVAFGSVAIAQSVGLTFSTIAELGWGVVGPQAVAAADPLQRQRLYRSGLATKLAAVGAAIPLAAIAACLLVTSYRLDAAVIAAGSACLALSTQWYFTGANQPGKIMLFDGLPRAVLVGVAALLVWFGMPPLLYGIALMASATFNLICGARLSGVPLRATFTGFRASLRDLRQHFHITMGRAASVGYTASLTALLGISSPGAVVNYAGADRILRMGLNGLIGVPNRLQSWIGVARGGVLRSRIRRSLVINLGLGLVAGLVYFVVAPFAAKILYAGQVAPTRSVILIASFVAIVICFSRGLGLAVVALGRSQWTAYANYTAAVFGVAAIVVLPRFWGADGAMLAALIAELAGVVVQAIGLMSSRDKASGAVGLTRDA
jgi:O-antigen/teichoic acid export membrane protein